MNNKIERKEKGKKILKKFCKRGAIIIGLCSCIKCSTTIKCFCGK